MQEQFTRFVETPSPATARELRREIRRQDGFTADTPWYERAKSLLAQQRHDEVIRVVTEAMPGAFMCPWAHLFLSQAHAALRATEESRREAYYTSVALELIGATGDGTRESPWHVLHVADEYAFLSARGLVADEQMLLENAGGGVLDALRCQDGRERHFVVTKDLEQ